MFPLALLLLFNFLRDTFSVENPIFFPELLKPDGFLLGL